MDEPTEVRGLRTLVDAVATADDEMVRVYLMHARDEPWRPGSVNRAGGPPIGVDEQTRPRHDGRYLQHLLTVDLDRAPDVRAAAKLDGVRALALFIRDALDNDAYEPGNGETAVVLLTDADLARGGWTGEPVDDPPARAYDLYPVDVPDRAFDDNDAFYADADQPAVKKLWELHCALMSADRVGGRLITYSGTERSDGFLLQFSEFLVDVNLGDAGTMYVFPDDAYWSCH